MKLLKRLGSLIALSGLLALISCGGGSSGGGGGFVVTDSGTGDTVFVDDDGDIIDPIDDPFTEWYDEFGNACGNLRPGCNYHADGFKIVDVEDPWWDDPDLWDNYFSTFYGEEVFESPSGVIYDFWGNALNKGNEIGNGRDVITNVAEAEKKALSNQAHYYAKKFGITQNQGMKLARTMNDFETLQSRSVKDIADFTKRLYGVNFSNLKNAVEKASQGDQSALQDVITDAASNFNITPESMKKMVGGLHGKLLKAAGIKLK